MKDEEELKRMTKKDLYEYKLKVQKALESDFTENDLEVNVFVKKANKMNVKNFMFLFQDTEFLLASSLSKRACQVIMLFRAICKYENRVDYQINQIAKLLSTSRQTISPAITELKEKGVILEFKDEFDARKSVFYINPESQWKGKMAKMSSLKTVFNDKGLFEVHQKQENPYQLTIDQQIDNVLTPGLIKPNKSLPLSPNQDFEEE